MNDQDVLSAVRQVAGLSEVGGLVPIPGGRSHRAWRTVGDLDAIVKVPVRDIDAGRVTRHVAMHRAAAATASVPQLLHFRPATADSFPLLVFEWVEGLDGHQVWDRLNPNERDAVMSGWGRTVASLHGRRCTSFSGHGAGDSWQTVVTAVVADHSQTLRRAALLPCATISRVAERLRELSGAITGAVVPSLTHLDLQLSNIVVKGGEFACLLDFEHARWWDPVADMVKLHAWVFDHHPGSAAAFLTRYYNVAGDVEFFDDRLTVCQGLEWLGGLTYWQRVGDDEMLCDYRSRLESWLSDIG